jgi:integrase
VVVYRVNGRQHKESSRTYDEARRLKSARQTDADRGEFDAASKIAFGDYAREWVDRYQGSGKGFREGSRDTYRLHLEKYVLPYFEKRLRRKLHEITPRDVAGFVGWLCEQRNGGDKPLSDATVRKVMVPLRSCLATAKREGLIRHNPASDAALPLRDTPPDEDDEDVRALTSGQLAALFSIVEPEYRTLFRLMASTALRISEAIALRWQDVTSTGLRACGSGAR